MKKKRITSLKNLRPRVPQAMKGRLGRLKRGEERTAEALSNLPRITNETVAEHREEVLSSARKYIYPLQHSRGRIIKISTTLFIVAVAVFFAYCGTALYKLRSTALVVKWLSRLPVTEEIAGSTVERAITEFHEQQLELSRLLEHKLAEYDVNIDVTTIATDVESTTAGKYAGAEVIWENIISTAGAGPDTVISIGDSISDYDMAVCFADKGSESTFVYVGEHPEKLVQDDAVKFIHTDSHYAAGTLEFLQK
jgi:hypothetical protein